MNGVRSGMRRRLAAIVFADVVGYSRMVAEDEGGALAGVRALRRRVIEPRVAAHGGRPFAALGDGFVAEFPSAVEAVTCAVAVQRDLAAVDGSGTAPGLPRGLAMRIGVDLGDVVVDPEGGVFGGGVNIAARLEALAEPGGIAVSGKTLEELRGRLPYPFEDAGEQTLKNIPWPVRVFVLSAAAIAELPPAGFHTTEEAPRRQRRAAPILGAGLFAAALAVGAATWWPTPPQQGAAPPATVAAQEDAAAPAAAESPFPGAAKPVVAVLPFANMSREARWDRLCDGLGEDIITDLARHPDLLVIARNSAFAYKGSAVEIREVGRVLGARYVLEGSLQADAGRLRVTAQLIDAPSGTHVWADRYERSEAELFAVQDEVVNHVVAAVAGFGGAIPRAELRHARRRPPASLRAYELYLLGYEQEARLDRDGTLRAIELLEAALQIDPQFSRAWTVLGWALGNAVGNGWAADPAAARVRQAEAVQKAAELDPGDGIALQELGLLRARRGDLAGAAEAVERALVVGANHADTLALLARPVSEVLGREDEALSLIKRAFALNPHAPDWYALYHARAAYFAGRFDTSLEASRRAPPLRTARLFQALALAQLGRAEEAAAATLAFRGAHPGFQAGEYAAFVPLTSPRARSLFLDGVRKAGLDAF